VAQKECLNGPFRELYAAAKNGKFWGLGTAPGRPSVGPYKSL